MPTRQQVYEAIDSERALQMQMIFASTRKPVEVKPLESFALYMEDYQREMRETLSRVWGPKSYEIALNTLRKIVALGVAAMEIHGAPHRKFPVPAKINGKHFQIERDSSREISEYERLFGVPDPDVPVKAQGPLVPMPLHTLRANQQKKAKAARRKKARAARRKKG